MSQNESIKAALLSGRSLTPLDALQALRMLPSCRSRGRFKTRGARHRVQHRNHQRQAVCPLQTARDAPCCRVVSGGGCRSGIVAALIGGKCRALTGIAADVSTLIPYIGEPMTTDKPHRPTMAELEDLFRIADDNPPTRDEWVRVTARALLYAWDEGLTDPAALAVRRGAYGKRSGRSPMTEFHERWGLRPRYPGLTRCTRRYWITYLGRCIDTARATLWQGFLIAVAVTVVFAVLFDD